MSSKTHMAFHLLWNLNWGILNNINVLLFSVVVLEIGLKTKSKTLLILVLLWTWLKLEIGLEIYNIMDGLLVWKHEQTKTVH